MSARLFINCLLIIMMSLHSQCKSIKGPDSTNNNAWSAAQNWVRFRIYTDKSSYQNGEDVWLNVEFENLSNNSVVLLVSPNQMPLIITPLYDLEKLLLTKMDINSASSIREIIPLHSNMYNVVPDLLKLDPKQVYHEKSNLNLDLWVYKTAFEQKGEHINLSLLPGAYTLQAIYHWDDLPYATLERQQQLNDLGAPLWTGNLESNKVAFTVTQ